MLSFSLCLCSCPEQSVSFHLRIPHSRKDLETSNLSPVYLTGHEQELLSLDMRAAGLLRQLSPMWSYLLDKVHTVRSPEGHGPS